MARRASTSDDVALVATGKSRAEVSALRHLREVYDALARGPAPGIADQDDEAAPAYSPGKGAKPQQRVAGTRSRGALDTVRALQQSSSSSSSSVVLVDRWLELETLARALDRDAAALQREFQVSESRTSRALRLPARGLDLPLAEDAKLLVLGDVLGAEAFAQYAADLFGELAQLRRRFALYGDARRQFQEQVQLRCIGTHRLRDMLPHAEWLEVANAALAALRLATTEDDALLVSHFPVLTRHCSPSTMDHDDDDHGDENAVAVLDLLGLLERLPPARERLVALCFEQIGDVRRGTGLAPPPEGVRPHKLAALARQAHADTQCSRDEMERVLTWLDNGFDDERADVSRAAFVDFHAAVSDTYAREDAEFVAFLMCVWRFELPPALDVVREVVNDYEARCQEHTNVVRKREVLKKLDHARAALPSKLASLRRLVGHVETVAVHSREQLERLQTHQHLDDSGVLSGLRRLRLNGLSLREFPVFVVALPLLGELDLGDNQLRDALPLATIGGMKTLRTLVLRDNFLSDRSFVESSSDLKQGAWQGLSGLTALDLSRNQLTTIPGVVVQLQGLQQLSLASNKLRDSGLTRERAAQWAAQGFPRLQTLDLRENELATVPDAALMTGKASLEMLYAQDNQLVDVPESFASLEALREAHFTRNRLKQLAKADLTSLLTRCKRLTELVLDQNQLRVFPVQSCASLSSVESLRAIRWPKNRLRVLPALTNITFAACETLDLRANALTEIADAFFAAFPRLRACHLQQNALVRLPDSIATCAKLQVLELHENRLEYVPPALPTLRELSVLNLRENQLVAVPTEWHAFAQHREGELSRPAMRVLQTLYLQRNPFKNKVLQALVDGSGGGASGGASSQAATPFKSSGTQICEMYVRKLIDTLAQSVPVQSLARAVHAEALDDPESDDDDLEDDKNHEEERRGVPVRWRTRRRRWKGRARFVLQHIETQLRAKCEQSPDRARLVLSAPSFQKLLQKLLVASTKKELQLMSQRFQTSGGAVDGLAFLAGVEAVGLFNALPDQAVEKQGAREQARCESVHKPVDAVASILQYLHVAHEQKTRPATPVAAKEAATEPAEPRSVKSRPGSAPAKAKAVAKQSPPRGRPHSAKPKTPKETAPVKMPGRDADAAYAQLERQRQRIQVLEQQLLDQHVLRLAEQNAHRADVRAPQDAGGQAATADAASASRVETEPSASVLVDVKQLNSGTSTSERVVVAVARDATVGALKLAIARRLGVDVARQVLVVRDLTASARAHVRLQDAARLAGYFPSTASTSSQQRWGVSLLESEGVRAVDWAGVVAQRASQPTPH